MRVDVERVDGGFLGAVVEEGAHRIAVSRVVIVRSARG